VRTSSGRTPVCPEANVLQRKNIMARTTSSSTGAPEPAAWDRMRLRCRSRRRSGGMWRLASAPNPVDTP
jgi:hypothetical protein